MSKDNQKELKNCISIQEVPNILELARQKAALGLYKESIAHYNRGLHIMMQHYKLQSDPFLKEQWKKTDEEIRAEVSGIANLYKSLKCLRGENSKGIEAMVDIPLPLDPQQKEKPQQNVNPNDKQPAQPKKVQNLIDHFGYAPFEKKKEDKPVPKIQKEFKEENFVYQRDVAPPPEPKKDPLVWDPPSPQHAAAHRKPKAYPNWAKGGGGNKQKGHAKPGSGPSKYRKL